MIRKYILPLLALAGIVYGIITAVRSHRTTPPAPPVSEAAQSPYPFFVAGAGIVEAQSENIAIGTHIAGIVAKAFVDAGSHVASGDPLFMIDDRTARAELQTRNANVQLAEAQLQDAKDQAGIYESVAEKGAISLEDLTKHRDAVRTAEAQFAVARAQQAATATEIERLTVRASVAGQVLQLNIHPGEFAFAGVLQKPLLLLGNIDKLVVRVDVDENDAWRILPGAAGAACLRGNKDIRVPLQFVRFEPYVVPKKSLTGESTERVDTRVLQVIYRFDRGELPIFVGQQMDVFIDAAPRGVMGLDKAPL